MVTILSGNLTAGRISTLDGSGEQTRGYVYVGDVVRGNSWPWRA
jgi:UDP-glucose 4-epimerase